MANLVVKRVDPADAEAALADSIRETIPTAGVNTRTEGALEQRSLGRAFGREFAHAFDTHERERMVVIATLSAPRPIRIHANYIPLGRGAGPVGILYELRLRIVVPGRATFQRGRFRSGEFAGDPAVASVLSNVKDLGSTIWRLLSPSVLYNQKAYTIEPSLEVVPDDGGAVLVAFSAPGAGKFGFGGPRLILPGLLELADAFERTLASVPGVTPAPTPNAPLPD